MIKSKVIRKTNIVDVVKSIIKLKKVGNNYKGHTPYHQTKEPTFFVSQSKQIFKCFTTGQGGNVIDFLCSIPFICENPDCKFHCEPRYHNEDEAIQLLINKNYYKNKK